MSQLLAQTRDHGFASIPPITQREMQAFASNMWIKLTPFHIEALIAIDSIRRKVWTQRREAEARVKAEEREKKLRHGKPVNP